MPALYAADSGTMVIKAIAFKPNVGDVLECDFGEFPDPPLNPIYDGRLAPEIRKKRLVVILHSGLPNGCCMIVPISSSGDNKNAVDRGFHVHLPPDLVTPTRFYDRRDRWAIAECVTHVSKERLFPIWNGPQRIRDKLPRDVVTAIQKAVIRAISAFPLLPPEAADQVKQPTK